MHILISTTYHLSAYYGGNEHYAHHLSLGLVKAGHQVTYLTTQAQSAATYPYTIQVLPTPTYRNQAIPSLSWLNYQPVNNTAVYHVCGSGFPSLVLATKLKQKLPTILTYQAPNNPANLFFEAVSQVERKMIGRAYCSIITTSPHNLHLLTTQYPHLNLTCIPLMIAPEFTQKLPSKATCQHQVHFDPTQKNLLFVGQLDHHHYYKGLDVALDALQQLPQTFHLHIIGGGNTLSDYQKKATQAQLDSRTHFYGQVPNAQIPTYMKAADVFILPSTSSSEGFGIVLIEAMACQTPTITTTAIGAASWYRQAQVTHLVEPNQPQLLAQAIKQVIASPNKAMLQRAYTLSQQCTVASMTKKTLDVYQQHI